MSTEVIVNGETLNLEDAGFGPVESIEIKVGHDTQGLDANETYVDDIYYRCQTSGASRASINTKTLELLTFELMTLREIIQMNRGALSREDVVRFDRVTSSTDIQVTLARRS